MCSTCHNDGRLFHAFQNVFQLREKRIQSVSVQGIVSTLESRLSNHHSVPLMVNEIINYCRTFEISFYYLFCCKKIVYR